MKKTLLLLLFSVTLFAQKYNDGYKEGYKNGYCYDSPYGCYAPYAPYPDATVKTSYNDGYNDGFIKGREAKENENKKTYSNNNYSAPKTSYEYPIVTNEDIKKEYQKQYDELYRVVEVQVNNFNNTFGSLQKKCRNLDELKPIQEDFRIKLFDIIEAHNNINKDFKTINLDLVKIMLKKVDIYKNNMQQSANGGELSKFYYKNCQ